MEAPLSEEVAPIAPGQGALRLWLGAFAVAFGVAALVFWLGYGPRSAGLVGGANRKPSARS